MAHNGAPQTNPEEAAAEAARLAAAQLRQAATNKEIKMTFVKGAEGENGVLMPGDAENQVKWVTSELNTGKLTETQRRNLKPEAQEAYAGWLAERDARAAREQAVTAQKADMAAEARGKLGDVFEGADKYPQKVDDATKVTKGAAKPVQEQLGTSRPGSRGFDEIDEAGRVIPDKSELKGPVERGFGKVGATPLDEALERGNNKTAGNGHELVSASDGKPAPKTATARPVPSPRPRRRPAEQQPAPEPPVETSPQHEDARAKAAEPTGRLHGLPRTDEKPVTNVKSEPGDGQKAGDIIADAFGGKSTEHATSPADTKVTDQHQRPKVETAETTQHIPQDKIDRLDASKNELSDTARHLATTYADTQAALGATHPRTRALRNRLDDQLAAENGVMGKGVRDAARQRAVEQATIDRAAQYKVSDQAPAPQQEFLAGQRRPVDSRISEAAKSPEMVALAQTPEARKLGLGLIDAELNSPRASMDAGRKVNAFLEEHGITGDTARAAKLAMRREGESFMQAAQQEDLRAAGRADLAQGTEQALFERLQAQNPNVSAEDNRRRTQEILSQATQLRNEVRENRLNELAATAAQLVPGSREASVVNQQLHEAVGAYHPNLGETDRARFVQEKIQQARGEAVPAATPRPEVSERAKAMEALDQKTARRLGFAMAEAATNGDTDTMIKTGQELEKYLKSAGLDEEATRQAKAAIIDNGELDLLGFQQAEALTNREAGKAQAAQDALEQKIAERFGDLTPDQRAEMARQTVRGAADVYNDVRNQQFAQLTAEALAAKAGTPEREAAEDRMRAFTEANRPGASGPQNAVFVAEILERGAAAKAAANPAGTPEAEIEWPAEDGDTKPIADSVINKADNESKEPSEKLSNFADHYAAAFEASGRNPKDPRVVEARHRFEQTIRDQYPDVTDNAELAKIANDVVDGAYDRMAQARAEAQNAAEQTGTTAREVIDDAAKAGEQQRLTPEWADRKHEWKHELARRITDIPASPDNMDEYVRAQHELRQYLAQENPGMTPEKVNETAKAYEQMANHEAALAERAFANYYGQTPEAEFARKQLLEYVQNDPRFVDASPQEQYQEMQRLLVRARDRVERRNMEAGFNPDQLNGPDDGTGGAGAQQRPPRPRPANANTGNTTNTGDTENTERYENYDRLLESLKRFNNGEELDTETRERLLRDLHEYSQSESQSQANRDFAAGKFEKVMEGMSKRQQNAFRRQLAEEARTELNDDRFRGYFKRPGRTFKLRRKNAKARRATARGLREVNAERGIDANGDSYEDLMSVPEGGFNEGDLPMIEMTKRGIVNRLIGRHPTPRGAVEVQKAYGRAQLALNNPYVSPADKQAIYEYRQWLMDNYQNFDWNQLSGNQDAGFLPRFMRRPSRRNDEPGIADRLNNMVVDAAKRANQPRGAQNYGGPRGPQAGRPGPAGPTAQRFRPRPGQPQAPPRIVPPQVPRPRPQGPPQPGPRR